MEELRKIYRILDKERGDCALEVLLTLDSVMGQNGLAQAEHFNKILHLTGIVLTKYDNTVMNKVKALIAGGTAGDLPAAGTLYMQDQKYTRLLLETASNPINFPRVVWQEPIQFNVGTRFTMVVLSGTAYPDENGLLYDAVITA